MNLKKIFLCSLILLTFYNLYPMLDEPVYADHICAGAQLSGRDLSGINFEGRDLSGADLSFANLRGARFAGANLRGTNLKWAILVDVQGLDEAFVDPKTNFDYVIGFLAYDTISTLREHGALIDMPCCVTVLHKFLSSINFLLGAVRACSVRF